MTYRVTYPLITQDGFRDFESKEEAERFADERRNNSRYQTMHAWRRVEVTRLMTAYDKIRAARV
jgi:hypothetical protein